MPETHFYFTSTPLHLLLSSAIALSKPNIQHVLLLIDQPNISQNLYYDALKQWHSSPFTDVFLSEGKLANAFQKVQSRKKTFSRIGALTEKFKPTCVFTGSDRRLEFQYCMHLLDESTSGIYIDEGVFSYILPSLTKRISHHLFDSIGKKMIYGSWYASTAYTGGSHYISDILAAYPKLVHKGLSKKNINALDENLLNQPALKNFASIILESQQLDFNTLANFDVFICLPHQSLLADSASQSKWLNLITELSKSDKKLAVKYHPRDDHDDILALKGSNNICIIPRKVMFEALLPGLKNNCHIIGDFSSVLINIKWLRPSLTVIAVLPDNSQRKNDAFISLYQQLGISICKIDNTQSLIDMNTPL